MRYDVSRQQDKRINISAEKAGIDVGGPEGNQRQSDREVYKVHAFVDAEQHNPGENGTDKEAADIEIKKGKTHEGRPADKDGGGTAKYLREY